MYTQSLQATLKFKLPRISTIVDFDEMNWDLGLDMLGSGAEAEEDLLLFPNVKHEVEEEGSPLDNFDEALYQGYCAGLLSTPPNHGELGASLDSSSDNPFNGQKCVINTTGLMPELEPTVVEATTATSSTTIPTSTAVLNGGCEGSDSSQWDPRWLYADMISNAFNTADKQSLSKTLGECCADDVELVVKFVGEPQRATYSVLHQEVHGISEVKEYLDLIITSIPDISCRLEKVKLHEPQKTEALVVCYIQFSGSQLYGVLDRRSDPQPNFYRHSPLLKIPVATAKHNLSDPVNGFASQPDDINDSNTREVCKDEGININVVKIEVDSNTSRHELFDPTSSTTRNSNTSQATIINSTDNTNLEKEKTTTKTEKEGVISRTTSLSALLSGTTISATRSNSSLNCNSSDMLSKANTTETPRSLGSSRKRSKEEDWCIEDDYTMGKGWILNDESPQISRKEIDTVLVGNAALTPSPSIPAEGDSGKTKDMPCSNLKGVSSMQPLHSLPPRLRPELILPERHNLVGIEMSAIPRTTSAPSLLSETFATVGPAGGCCSAPSSPAAPSIVKSTKESPAAAATSSTFFVSPLFPQPVAVMAVATVVLHIRNTDKKIYKIGVFHTPKEMA